MDVQTIGLLIAAASLGITLITKWNDIANAQWGKILAFLTGVFCTCFGLYNIYDAFNFKIDQFPRPFYELGIWSAGHSLILGSIVLFLGCLLIYISLDESRNKSA